MHPPTSFDEGEDCRLLMTVEQAARILHISRSRAYAMAHEYLDSGGTAGMPVIRLGPGCLRVPRWALMVLATTGQVVRLCDVEVQPSGAPHDR